MPFKPEGVFALLLTVMTLAFHVAQPNAPEYRWGFGLQYTSMI